MRGHLVSFQFCWVVLLRFFWLSALHCTLTWAGTRFSRELKVTRECVIPSKIVIFFPTGCECVRCYGQKSRIGWQILAVTMIHIRLPTQWYLISDGMWRCQVPWAKTRIGWHRFWSFHDKLHIISSPLPPPLRRLCNILTIPLIGGKPLYLPPCTLLATINSVKKYKIAPKSGKNNGNFLRSTRIFLRGYSHSPLYDIKNQDNLLRQGKQLHTNCIMKVSKVNCMMIKWNTIELFF